MELFKEFDKINIPMYVCSNNWVVVYRNSACKKYANSPRVNSSFNRCFLDKETTVFPQENGPMSLVGCFIRGTYKTSLCFEYKGYAVIMFPVLFDFDLLFGDMSKEDSAVLTGLFREIFDIIMHGSIKHTDKYGTLEKIRRYIFSAVENYVALSMFDTDNRVLGNVLQLYEFLCDKIIKLVNKSGYKVEYDISGITEFGEGLYVDTAYFSMAMSGLLLFCLSVSDDKKCRIEAEFVGERIVNTVSFTFREPMFYGKNGRNLKLFMPVDPAEYMSFAPIEDMCESLGWNFDYEITSSDELNVSVCFGITLDERTVFRSAGGRIQQAPEEIVSCIVEKVFGMLA